MAIKSTLRNISKAITGMSSSVADTFIQSAHEIAEACAVAFDGGLDISKDDLLVIQDAVTENASWKGTSAESARRSEIKSIVLAYTGLETATRVFKREFGELRREHFVKLAREIPKYVTPTDAALDCAGFFETRGKEGASGRTTAEKLKVHMTGAINNCGRNAALKQSLYALAKKHGVFPVKSK